MNETQVRSRAAWSRDGSSEERRLKGKSLNEHLRFIKQNNAYSGLCHHDIISC